MFRKKPKFYKRISILLVLILFSLGIVSLSKPILAQDINWALTGISSHANLKVGANNYLIWTLNDGKLIDNSTSDKAVGLIASNQARFQVASSFDCIITFDETVAVLNKIEVVAGYGTFNSNVEMSLDVELYYNGEWHDAGRVGRFDHRDGVPGAYWYWHDTGGSRLSMFNVQRGTYTFNSGAPWNNVEKIRVHVFFGCAPWHLIDHYIYEIRAFGSAAPAYQDIGLKVQTPTGIVSIAAEIGAPTSALRIAKNGVIYGIVLVDPGDPNDSGVRIKTSSGIKALRKYP